MRPLNRKAPADYIKAFPETDFRRQGVIRAVWGCFVGLISLFMVNSYLPAGRPEGRRFYIDLNVFCLLLSTFKEAGFFGNWGWPWFVNWLKFHKFSFFGRYHSGIIILIRFWVIPFYSIGNQQYRTKWILEVTGIRGMFRFYRADPFSPYYFELKTWKRLFFLLILVCFMRVKLIIIF